MQGRRRSYVVDALAVAVGLPVAILCVVSAVWLHRTYCEWNVPWNPNSPQLTPASRIIPLIHAKDTCRHQPQFAGSEFDMTFALFAGVIAPAVMLVAGTVSALICGGALFRRSGAPRPLQLDPATGQFALPPQPRPRLQFSLLALILLTVVVAATLKFALAMFPLR